MPYRCFLKLFLFFSKILLLCILLFSSSAVFSSPPAAAQDNWIRQVVVRIIKKGNQRIVLMGREVQYSDHSQWVDNLWIVYPEKNKVEQVDPEDSQPTTKDLNVCLNPPDKNMSLEELATKLGCYYLFIGPPRF